MNHRHTHTYRCAETETVIDGLSLDSAMEIARASAGMVGLTSTITDEVDGTSITVGPSPDAPKGGGK